MLYLSEGFDSVDEDKEHQHPSEQKTQCQLPDNSSGLLNTIIELQNLTTKILNHDITLRTHNTLHIYMYICKP